MFIRTVAALLLTATVWAAPLPPAAPLGTSATDLAVSVTAPASPTQASVTAVVPASPYQTQVVVALTEKSTNPREDALAKATTQGLQQVLAGLNADAETIATLTSGTDVSKYLNTYKIVKETLTPSYSLTADVTFSQALVDAAIGRSPSAETNPLAVAETAPVVILPLIAFEGRQWLWEDDNPWRQALAGAAAQVSGTPMLTPQADADALRTLPASAVAESYTLTPELSELQTQYKARGILIADAAIEEGGDQPAIIITARWLGLDAPVINLRQPVENGTAFETTLAELAQATLAEAAAQLASAPAGSNGGNVTWDTGAALYLRLMATDVTELERLLGWVNGYPDTSGTWQMVAKNEAIMAVQTPNIQGLESFLRTQGLRLNPDGPFTRVEF